MSILQLHPAIHIKLDWFPLNITEDGEAFLPSGFDYRVIVTDSYFYILTDSIEGPCTKVSEKLVSFAGNHREGFTITTDKATYVAKKAPSCGCGSQIRGFHPYLGVPHV